MKIKKEFRPWIWTCSWLILFLIVGVLVYEDQSDWRKKILEAYWGSVYLAKPDALPNVLVLGDSLVGRSFPMSYEESDLFGNGVTWANIWMGGASYRDFSGFFSESSFRHDLIIINLSSLANDRVDMERRKIPRRYQKIMERYLLGDPVEQIIKEHYKKTREYCGGRDEREIRNLVESFKKRYSPNDQSQDDLAAFLGRLKGAARKVVVVELPRTEFLAAQLDGSLTTWKNYYLPLLKNLDIEFIKLGNSLPEYCYCDGSHPNDRGREIRRQQLIDLVREKLPSTL